MFPTFQKYLKLVDDIITDFLGDLKSLRVWLILWSYIFNIIILYLVYMGKADYKLSGVGIGLLTIVYTYFFASKHAENLNKSQDDSSDDK